MSWIYVLGFCAAATCFMGGIYIIKESVRGQNITGQIRVSLGFAIVCLGVYYMLLMADHLLTVPELSSITPVIILCGSIAAASVIRLTIQDIKDKKRLNKLNRSENERT